MAQPVEAPGEARRPTSGLPTAGPRTFPAGGCLGVISSKASAQYGFSTVRSGRVGPFQRAKKLGGHLPGRSRSERQISLLAETKTSKSLVPGAASGGFNRRWLVRRARALHWVPDEHENGLLCDLPGRAVLADYAATSLLSILCETLARSPDSGGKGWASVSGLGSLDGGWRSHLRPRCLAN